MDVKEAVSKAVSHIRELFEHEDLSNIGLEEAYLENGDFVNYWVITVGFSRPWDYPKNNLAEMVGKPIPPKRSYKIVRINDDTGVVESVRNWIQPSANELPF